MSPRWTDWQSDPCRIIEEAITDRQCSFPPHGHDRFVRNYNRFAALAGKNPSNLSSQWIQVSYSEKFVPFTIEHNKRAPIWPFAIRILSGHQVKFIAFHARHQNSRFIENVSVNRQPFLIAIKRNHRTTTDIKCLKFLCSSVNQGIATNDHEELALSNSYTAAAIVRSIIICWQQPSVGFGFFRKNR